MISKVFHFVNSAYSAFYIVHIINTEVGTLTKTQQKAMATRIKHRRESLGFTQESFCEAINLSASSYTKIENAFQRPALVTLIKIAEHLDMSLDYIVFGKKDSDENQYTNEAIALIKNMDMEKLRYASKFLMQFIKLATPYE